MAFTDKSSMSGEMNFPGKDADELDLLFLIDDWENIDVVTDGLFDDADSALAITDREASEDNTSSAASHVFHADVPIASPVPAATSTSSAAHKTVVSKAVSRPLMYKAAKGKQKTKGEPCLLRVCQFPVMISNSFNIGDMEGISRAVDQFFMDDTRMVRSGATLFEGKDAIKAFLVSFSELMPDIICHVTSIKLKKENSVIFKMNVEGTFVGSASSLAHSDFTLAKMAKEISPATVSDKTNMTYFQKHMFTCMQLKFASYIQSLEAEGHDESFINKIREMEHEVLVNNRQCFCKFDLCGRLYFSAEAKAAWAENTIPLKSSSKSSCLVPEGDGVVCRFESTCQIKSITLSEKK